MRFLKNVENYVRVGTVLKDLQEKIKKSIILRPEKIELNEKNYSSFRNYKCSLKNLIKTDTNKKENQSPKWDKEISKTHHKEIHDSNHISAAIGYSIFDKSKDKCVNDVFKRADKAMYENKREIKKDK